MLIAEARVETERASRYLDQLCRHAQQMGRHPHYRPGAHGGDDTHRPPEVRHVEWSDTDGTVRLSLGRWILQATPDALVLRVEAAGEEDLQRMQDLIAARVEKIGRRDHLSVTWQQSEAPGTDDQAHVPHPTEHGHPGGMTSRWTVRAVAGVVALMAVAHLVLGGSLLAASKWLGWGAGAVVLALVLVKVVGMGGFVAHRRRKRARWHGHGPSLVHRKRKTSG
ncbi:DUF2218 domain-containing protein [Streptomyces sp. CdTB01]|uniref:DUF2218 domain-containing protein n=1 Tax=Streptomyces sp. CdTB01 TaxID=1725411 RepID=UPI00073ACAED|nr:DUF2218 domain-containing protein [Streptomyces sp. CdTB01]ALV33080.1 hypothetical protein AS200_14230 [Streptomyces sp. CdTB01]